MHIAGGYKPSLDGVRAGCIMLTLAGHIDGTPWYINGSLGVDVFFALSGWLITVLLMLEHSRSGTVSLQSFYLRRFFRIVPMYAVTIVLYGMAALAAATLLNQAGELDDFLTGLPFFLTFNGEYMQHTNGLLFGHSWTLGIEEKFYILWPLLLLAALRGRTLAWPVLICAGALLVYLASAWELVIRGYVGLGFGALMAYLAVRHEHIASALGTRLSQYTCLLAAIAVYSLSVLQPHPWIWNIMVSLIAAPFVAGLWVSKDRSTTRQILEARPLPFLGKLTYAMYLTHVLTINVVTLLVAKIGIEMSWGMAFACCYLASILVGYVLHYTIEQPLIEFGRSMTRGQGASARRLPLMWWTRPTKAER